jgi:hypothetical protein
MPRPRSTTGRGVEVEAPSPPANLDDDTFCALCDAAQAAGRACRKAAASRQATRSLCARCAAVPSAGGSELPIRRVHPFDREMPRRQRHAFRACMAKWPPPLRCVATADLPIGGQEERLLRHICLSLLGQKERLLQHVCLSLLVDSINYLLMFFSYNRLVNRIFCHNLSAKQTNIG